MFIYLNPPRMFWAIGDTKVSLSRSNPSMEITEEILGSLDADQKRTLELSILGNVVSKISADFMQSLKDKASTAELEFVLSKGVSEIRKKYIGRMLIAGDTAGIEKILDAEMSAAEPREALINACKHALRAIRLKEDKFYMAIKEEELVIDEDGHILDEDSFSDEEAVQVLSTRRPNTTRAGMLLKGK